MPVHGISDGDGDKIPAERNVGAIVDSELAMLIVYKQTPRPLRKICQVLPTKEGPHTPELPSKILPRTMTINPTLPDLRGVASADGEPTETSLPWVWPGHPRTTLLQVKWGHCYQNRHIPSFSHCSGRKIMHRPGEVLPCQEF